MNHKERRDTTQAVPDDMERTHELKAQMRAASVIYEEQEHFRVFKAAE